MARAKMREATLLGLFFYVPLGYTLLARFLHRYTDDLTVDIDEELRLGKPSEPVGNLLVRQRREVLAVCQCAADEECSGDGIIDFSILIPQGAVQRQSQQLALIVADQGCVSSSGFVHSLNKTANRETAWEDYFRLCSLGGSKGYFELLKEGHLSNPFKAGTVEHIMKVLKEKVLQ